MGRQLKIRFEELVSAVLGGSTRPMKRKRDYVVDYSESRTQRLIFTGVLAVYYCAPEFGQLDSPPKPIPSSTGRARSHRSDWRKAGSLDPPFYLYRLVFVSHGHEHLDISPRAFRPAASARTLQLPS